MSPKHILDDVVQKEDARGGVARALRMIIVNLLALAFVIVTSGRNCCKYVLVYVTRVLETLPRDLLGFYLLMSLKWDLRRRVIANKPIHHVFLERVRQHPRKEALIEVGTGRWMNFEELNNLANQYVNYFESIGLKNDDVITLFMENSIDFIAIWLGLSKIGVVSAFINSNLKLQPLAHSIRVAKTRAIVTTSMLLPALRDAQKLNLLPDDQPVFLTDVESHDDSKVVFLKTLIETSSKSEPSNVLCYIYTSGTTGNPKPAIIRHFRFYWMTMAVGKAFDIKSSDRMYLTLPLYHAAAGIAGIGQTIVRGTTCVIRKKFSASHFWTDCIDYECTASEYIGEICRYLLAQTPSALDRQHKVRTMWGNGLRAEIWEEFVKRFGITRIGEAYGSTEGNSNIVNIDNHVGACGFLSVLPFVEKLNPIRLVEVDEKTGKLVRDINGLCVPCRPGKTGEVVATIKMDDKMLAFDGYLSKEETENKVIRDCFVKGDRVFASSDLLYWDELGYLYFKDRRGDTFRWKGENVSTTEVEGILQPEKDVIDIAVYGVEIPEMEGRAGMAAITLARDVDVEKFLKKAGELFVANLANYAVPVFIRLVKELEMTGTFKLRKVDLQKQGFDLEKSNGDPIYYFNSDVKGYFLLDQTVFDAINTGNCTRF